MTITDVGVVYSGAALAAVAQRLAMSGRATRVHVLPGGATPGPVSAPAPVVLPADAADGAQVVLLKADDPDQHEEAVFELGGIGDTIPAGAVVVDLSNLTPAQSRHASERLAVYGVHRVEAVPLAPLPGRFSRPARLLVGADAAGLRLLAPVLPLLGAEAVPVGTVGRASAARLVLEDAYGMAFAALAEGSTDAPGLMTVDVSPRTVRTVVDLVGDRAARTSFPRQRRSREDAAWARGA